MRMEKTGFERSLRGNSLKMKKDHSCGIGGMWSWLEGGGEHEIDGIFKLGVYCLRVGKQMWGGEKKEKSPQIESTTKKMMRK